MPGPDPTLSLSPLPSGAFNGSGFASGERSAADEPPAVAPPDRRLPRGLGFERRSTRPQASPFDEVVWERRNACIATAEGTAVFEQAGVEFPKSWSQLATSVVASKYFRGHLGSADREWSVRQMVLRVVKAIAGSGRDQGYFASDADSRVFEDELIWLLLHQRLSFNSPVWFNVGVDPAPQCSACFINGVEDTMEGILDLAKVEAMLFKFGSGAGSNLSRLRSSLEDLRGGGKASGPVSFMRGYDAFAGVIKSGGKTRRAAKMVILDVDHPDIMEFIESKAREERKAQALIRAGYDGSFEGEAYRSVFFQNANHSVRVSDAFMRAVEEDAVWTTRAVTDGRPLGQHRARAVMDAIAEAAWSCGDPGLQFDDTINTWHTCPASGRIRASNPCSEFMFVDDSACNLASLNLLAFQRPDGELDVESFRHAVEIAITAQDILVGAASYPTEAIRANSLAFRPLGLGYANLGALLMSRGLAYDSEAGRAYAAAVTALMQGVAWRHSARLAAAVGPFAGWRENAASTQGVLERHRAALSRVDSALVPLELLGAVRRVWDEVGEAGRPQGYRNAQVTVLAPTGTIAFMMDCDTTGVEPDMALVKYKKLVGGGTLKMVTQAVPRALARLGYRHEQIAVITAWIDQHDTIEGAPGLRQEHLPVFDCAFRSPHGTRVIEPLGHLRMMAAVQPFISGAISKTVNMPGETTSAQIADVYRQAWQFGLKAVAVYRDGCKLAQPLTTAEPQKRDPGSAAPSVPQNDLPAGWRPVRRKLPIERSAVTHKFDVAGHEGYVTVGLYEDGTPGEVFIVMAKAGSTVAGLMDSFATAVSLALQYGVPAAVLCDKFSHTRYEPSGFTGNPAIPIASSVTDYIFRWLAHRFLTAGSQEEAEAAPSFEAPGESGGIRAVPQLDSPPCSGCGALMIRSGTCYRCANCGSTSGCS